MATYQRGINYEYTTCPFNPNHKVPAHRFQLHIIKCQKSSNVDLIPCPFNASHQVPPLDYLKHLKVCDQKSDLINPCTNRHLLSLYLSPKKNNGPQYVSDIYPSHVVFRLQMEENWDQDKQTDNSTFTSTVHETSRGNHGTKQAQSSTPSDPQNY